jgi:hypothetical protein
MLIPAFLDIPGVLCDTPEMLRPLTLLTLAILAHAQNPYATLPRNYALEFENDSLRVSRVKFFPGDRLPAHSHPSIPTVYVYLTDAGPIRFIHKTPRFTLERPSVKAGSVRFNRNANVETHEVEYLGADPSEYLRIELKTTPGPPHRDARLRNDADFPWEDSSSPDSKRPRRSPPTPPFSSTSPPVPSSGSIRKTRCPAVPASSSCWNSSSSCWSVVPAHAGIVGVSDREAREARVLRCFGA